ncbi:hypothetical protein BCR34DRAFT_586366 [Clohesyomyces aquaticus]|uniref:Uncharacterized protein n=1 Tax=Clohesyomyces aquaticus TaxID=1231657 RepID=A0A1Y1ZTJ8_9PLEO|nr:hypothetical protein BCR34DRAFT_586366 [Clohesyomyces aquaticus]
MASAYVPSSSQTVRLEYACEPVPSSPNVVALDNGYDFTLVVGTEDRFQGQQRFRVCIRTLKLASVVDGGLWKPDIDLSTWIYVPSVFKLDKDFEYLVCRLAMAVAVDDT